MENNIWQEEIPQNQEFLKSMKKIKPMKKIPSRVIQPIETKNRYSPLETEESPTETENARTDSSNTTVMVKQNATNTATQNTKNSNDKTKRDTPDKKKLPVTVTLGDTMVKDIKS